MNILLLLDTNIEISKGKLNVFLSSSCKHIKFTIYDKPFSIDEKTISKPNSFDRIYELYGTEFNGFDRVFCFTDSQYNDNYFFHKYENLSIFSFAYWDLLTGLPKTNGLIYFIVDYLALEIDTSKFRHSNITGCIYDFLRDKRGIDNGMRQARFCPACLTRVSDLIADKNTQGIFEDVKTLMDLLSASSKWNNDIFENVRTSPTILTKRKSKIESMIKVVIASPGDTKQERELLLHSLERRFRVDGHEKYCGFRIIVNGWEDLASQNGYPQDVINSKLIEESDFVISVFKHKLGTPTIDHQTGTQRAESGTVEELLQALDNSEETHPIGMSYFHSSAPIISVDSPDFEDVRQEWNRVKKFKEQISRRMIYKLYPEPTELLNMVIKDLAQNISNFIIK